MGGLCVDHEGEYDRRDDAGDYRNAANHDASSSVLPTTCKANLEYFKTLENQVHTQQVRHDLKHSNHSRSPSWELSMPFARSF
jgi:hypothetical protein